MAKYLIGGNDIESIQNKPVNQKLLKCNIEINGNKFPIIITNAEIGIDPEIAHF